MKPLNQEAETAFNTAMREEAYNAMLQLKDTLHPKYDAKGLGYNNADHARLMIVQYTTKRMDKMAAEHLRKHG